MLLVSAGGFLLSGFVVAADLPFYKKFCFRKFHRRKNGDPILNGGLDNNTIEVFLRRLRGREGSSEAPKGKVELPSRCSCLYPFGSSLLLLTSVLPSRFVERVSPRS